MENISNTVNAPALPYRGLEKALETIAVVLMLCATSVVVLQVFCRYVLNASLPWPEEAAQFCFVWAVFLGMALLTFRDRHIAISLFVPKLSPKHQSIHTVFTKVITVIACIILVIHGIDFMNRTLQVLPALRVPLKYLFMAVPVGSAIALVFLSAPIRGFGWWSGLATLVLGLIGYYALREAGGVIFAGASSTTILMIVTMLLIFAEVPIVYALVVGSFAGLTPLPPLMLVTITQNMSGALNSFTLLAIPFFILAAAVMNAGGITVRIVNLAYHLVGHFRGGLAQANIVTNVMLAGVSGSSTADASATAKLLVPEMEKHGYGRAFSCALTAASSTLANMIPPGLGLIIYAALASVSVGALFVGTILPGLLVATALSIVAWIISVKSGYGGTKDRSTAPERWRSLLLATPALCLPVMIVGGVRFGIFTATEAGAMAFVFALFCGALIYRGLTAQNLSEAFREAVEDTVAVAVIIAAASPFAWILTFEQTPQKIAQWLAALTGHKIYLLLLINLFLIFVGLFIEMIAAMVILVPILVPVVIAAGVDPLQFGIIMVMNLVIGALTPPLGVLVFTTARVGGAPSSAVFRAILPFIAAQIIVLLVVTMIPQITLLPIQWFGP
ncbi:C4-dicarboxylate ABC transporter substrate-binding protein [Amylibacter ulvae]|uniref:C4-dicarboxylate ABC transporter substrate-binding protein n=1 Tax=Paramylibacter ulvae TaxID=1651968 RepID=A0ABQ3CUM6_9RHOB|nr:TRAP transporter large permease subunit [Amylibacter ulvae]GHA44039.1 C4-dicarboxylate ABC transporter substrate-binding protein [Amylibacter ulvae]